ncbi:hypothetical protein B0A49_08759 [Cryomyces minteri]|uniref:5-hydroxyisourate hydrolase n=1 Tax=Cryomyces minteri TaxID=331657 RepID=A0A4U0XGG9_9PEZI|nr:hypothetical protein B0A49_08759 [Cryomyces minteri]
MAAQRPPITCHVLDTTTGRPASSVAVTLTLLKPFGPSTPLTATTNSDGRVTAWQHQGGGVQLQEIFDNAAEHAAEHAQMVWALKFDTAAYYGEGNTFWPEVELRFFVKPGEDHYHVPLLLGPWSYTTYRGS